MTDIKLNLFSVEELNQLNGEQLRKYTTELRKIILICSTEIDYIEYNGMDRD